MSNPYEFFVLPRLVPPRRAVANRPLVGVFFSLHVQKLGIPQAGSMHGCLFRNVVGVTKLQLFDPSTRAASPVYEQRWDPLHREFTMYTPEAGVINHTVGVADVSDCWLPQAKTGPVKWFERTGQLQLMHGYECTLIRFSEPDSVTSTIVDESWICDELGIVISDICDSPDCLCRWELVHLQAREPPPEALEMMASGQTP